MHDSVRVEFESIRCVQVRFLEAHRKDQATREGVKRAIDPRVAAALM